MFPSAALLSFVFLALSTSTSASPLARRAPVPDAGPSNNATSNAAPATNATAATTTLPFHTKFAQKSGGGHDIVAADVARIQAMMERGRQMRNSKLEDHLGETPGVPGAGPVEAHGSNSYNVPVTNAAVTYTADVGIGMPATQYTLLIDTGSSNTWIGAGKKYTATSSSKDTGRSVSVSYGSGSFKGREYLDRVTLSSNLVIKQQSIGVASSSSGFDTVDGILGVGPTGMTSGTLEGSSDTIPTVSDNLFAQHTIGTEVLAVSFQPVTSSSSANGELTFGGTDPTKYTGQLTYTPITKASPASYYWGIDQSVNYNGQPLLSSTAGIVDTGTTLIYLASDAYQKYVKHTGATLDSATGFLRITAAQYGSLQNLNFVVAGRTFALTPNGQIWPRTMNDYIGGSNDYVYLVVNDLGTISGNGLDFINGFSFLTRFYSVFDTTNKRVGLATTQYTNANTN